MKIRAFSSLENEVYQVLIRTEDWSEGDRRLMEKFGDPEIDVGGTFTAPYLEFELDTRLVRIMSDSPFCQRFDFRDTADAAEQANVWRDRIVVRISDAVAVLRAQSDDFTREDVVTL